MEALLATLDWLIRSRFPHAGQPAESKETITWAADARLHKKAHRSSYKNMVVYYKTGGFFINDLPDGHPFNGIQHLTDRHLKE